MENGQKDEILEELWNIKDQFSSSCNKDIRQLVERVNNIARENGFDETVENRRNKKLA